MQVLQLPLLDSLPVSAKKRLGMAIGNQNILHTFSLCQIILKGTIAWELC
jgi:hypothetical protein